MNRWKGGWGLTVVMGDSRTSCRTGRYLADLRIPSDSHCMTYRCSKTVARRVIRHLSHRFGAAILSTGFLDVDYLGRPPCIVCIPSWSSLHPSVDRHHPVACPHLQECPTLLPVAPHRTPSKGALSCSEYQMTSDCPFISPATEMLRSR